MILSDKDLRENLESGHIKVDPSPDLDHQLGPASLDFRLGHELRVFDYMRRGYIDTREEVPDDLFRTITLQDDEPFVIQAGELVLANTYESLEIPPDLLARLDGRSSLGRLGIIVHGTAGLFHPGWRGKPTLELGNLGRMAVALYPMMKICTFTFHKLTNASTRPYGETINPKYMDQQTPAPSKLWAEFSNDQT